MRDSGFFEKRTDGAKTGGLIKPYNGDLGVQIDSAGAFSFRCFNCILQELRSHSFSSVALQHRHAPDLRAATSQHDPCGSHRLACGERQQMNCVSIVVIQLDLCWHSLFSDEHAHADRESLRQIFFSRHSPDSNGRIHSRSYALAVDVLQGEFLKAGAGYYFFSLAAAIHVFGITKTWKLRVRV